LRSCGTDIVCGCYLLRCSFNILYFLWLDNELFIILYNIIKTSWVILLLNYNIKYVFTICTRLNTCRMSISRFSLRDKVTLRLLKLNFYGAVVVELSKALDIRLSDWCCSVSMVWAQIPSRKEHNLTPQESNYSTVWFDFQTYISYLVFT
jgi:hypothetical protein